MIYIIKQELEAQRKFEELLLLKQKELLFDRITWKNAWFTYFLMFPVIVFFLPIYTMFWLLTKNE